MFQKILVLLAASLFATSVFAQVDNSLSTNVESDTKRPYQKGAYVGLEYMNVTDVSMKIKAKAPGYSETIDANGSTHIGFSGIRAGYNHTPEKGLGLNAGLAFLQAMNKSEYGETRTELLIPQANVSYSFNKVLMVYWGGNVSFLTKKGDDSIELKPDLGFQGGLSARMGRNVALYAGYSLMRFRIDETLNGVNLTGNASIGGFNSNLIYTF